MPSVSPKQHRFMEAVAHNPEFAAKAGVAQSVGKEFAQADDKAGITKNPGTGAKAHPGKNLGKYLHPKKGFASGSIQPAIAPGNVRPTQ